MKVTATLVSIAYAILIYVQINHLAQSFFTAQFLAYMMAIAIVIGCSFGYGGIFHLWLVNHRARKLACVPLVCMLFGSYMSIMASQSVFDASQKDRSEWRSLGVEGQSTRNELVRAGQAVESMQASGVSGDALQSALQRQQQALASHRAEKDRQKGTGENDSGENEVSGMNPLLQAICLELISHGLGIILFLIGASQVTGQSYNLMSTPRAPAAKKPMGVAA